MVNFYLPHKEIKNTSSKMAHLTTEEGYIEEKCCPEKVVWNDEATKTLESLSNTKKMISGNLPVLTTKGIMEFALQIFDPLAFFHKKEGSGPGDRGVARSLRHAAPRRRRPGLRQ